MLAIINEYARKIKANMSGVFSNNIIHIIAKSRKHKRNLLFRIMITALLSGNQTDKTQYQSTSEMKYCQDKA